MDESIAVIICIILGIISAIGMAILMHTLPKSYPPDTEWVVCIQNAGKTETRIFRGSSVKEVADNILCFRPQAIIHSIHRIGEPTDCKDSPEIEVSRKLQQEMLSKLEQIREKLDKLK